MKKHIEIFIPASIAVMLFSAYQSESFKNAKETISNCNVDTTIILTKKTKLGNTRYSIEKPQDCIENVLLEEIYEKSYEIYPRNNQNSKGVFSIIIDRTYLSRIKTTPTNRTFTDSLLGKTIAVNERTAGDILIRECEISNGNDFIYIYCTGATLSELQKYYNVAKSLSTK